MQASIEIFVDHFNEDFHQHLQKITENNGHVYKYSQQDDSYSYCILLGHDYWNSYRYSLLKYVQEHLPLNTRLEFDRQGDEMDKYILYTYKGGTKFHMIYRKKNVLIDGCINHII